MEQGNRLINYFYIIMLLFPVFCYSNDAILCVVCRVIVDVFQFSLLTSYDQIGSKCLHFKMFSLGFELTEAPKKNQSINHKYTINVLKVKTCTSLFRRLLSSCDCTVG